MTTETCRIYVASLSDYNAGVLHGEWVDVTDVDAMHEAIATMLAESPTAKLEGLPAEEWAIHDYEGFGDLRLSEYADLDNLCSIAEGVTEHGPAFLGWLAREPNHNTDKSDFEDAYHGEWDSLADYVQDWWEQTGSWKPAENWWDPTNYVDWGRMAHDLELSGDIFTVETPTGWVWVFQNR